MPDFSDKRIARPQAMGRLCQVIDGVVALREAPHHNARLATQALMGETLFVLGEEAGFHLCQLQRDRYVGWVWLSGISGAVTNPTHKISALSTFLFPAPDLKTPPRATLSLGARLTVTGERDGVWVECQPSGWVHARHLALIDALETDPAGLAERFLDVPYLWGGRTSHGLDCSGLIQQAFEACGVILPRDSDMQAAWAGEPVEDWQAPGALKRGDLVCWDGHVGILTAPDMLLHANAYHLQVEREPLAGAIARIRAVAGEVIGVRRVSLAPGGPPAWLTVP